MTTPQTHTEDGRPRARGLSIVRPGEPGLLNAITDVDGIEVGVTTLISGDAVRTGVTAILPRGRDGVGQPCAAGWYSLNGNGEMTGTTWIDEAGSFNLPVVLSNTHAVGACHTGVVSWVNRIKPRLARQRLLAVCAETWDGYLNDINGGMGLYFAFLGLTQFVQIPHGAAGYGFGATVLEASVVYLLPGALTGFLVALASGRFIDRFGARPVLMIAALAGIVGFLFIALAHHAPWQIIAASILANAYIALGYGALPALVVAEVDAGETGVATSMNAIARTVGSSTAAALVAVLLGRTIPGTRLPVESSFVAIFVGGAITAALAMLLIAFSRPRERAIESVEARYESRAMNHEWG
jgi:Peptidase family S58/Major Facilitator Superfamily